MNMILTDISFLTFYQVLGWAVVIIAIAIVTQIPALRKKMGWSKDKKDNDDLSQSNSKAIVTEALKNLNCTVAWEKDETDLIGKYDYQSGHFRLRIKSESAIYRCLISSSSKPQSSILRWCAASATNAISMPEDCEWSIRSMRNRA